MTREYLKKASLTSASGASDVHDAVVSILEDIKPGGDDPLLSFQSVGVFVRRDWMDILGGKTQTGAFLGNIVWIIITIFKTSALRPRWPPSSTSAPT